MADPAPGTDRGDLEARIAVLEAHQTRDLVDRAADRKLLEEVRAEVGGIRLDLYAAKVGGRWVLGLALAFGGLMGWLVKLWVSK